MAVDIPLAYQALAAVFSEDQSKVLPPFQGEGIDHAIELEKNKTPFRADL